MSLNNKHLGLRVVCSCLKWNRVITILWRFLSGHICVHLRNMRLLRTSVWLHFVHILRIPFGCLAVLKQNVIRDDINQGSTASHFQTGFMKYRSKPIKASPNDDDQHPGRSCCSRAWLVLNPGLCSLLKKKNTTSRDCLRPLHSSIRGGPPISQSFIFLHTILTEAGNVFMYKTLAK